MKVLLLAEKPSVMRDLRQALTPGAGEELVFSHALGHLLRLAPPDAYDPALKSWSLSTLPFPVPADWRFKYEVGKEAGAVFLAVEQAARALPPGSEIVNCCDAGREGELIFWTVFDRLFSEAGQRRFKWSRLWAQTMTHEGLRQAYAARKPASEYAGLRAAAYSRQHADWYLGLSVTRLATIGAPRGEFGGREVKRCGRVKSPVLGFVVERDRIIGNFTPETIYSARGFFPSVAARKQPWVAADLSAYAGRPELLGRSGIDPSDKRKIFWEKAKADEFARECASAGASGDLSGGVYAVTDETREAVRKPPAAYDLTAAQKDAFSRFGLTPKDTLAILQDLYETKKLLTYPRTDSCCFPDDYQDTLIGALNVVVPALNDPAWEGRRVDAAKARLSRVFDSSGVSDHFALAPTGQVGQLASLSGPALQVYRMVVERCLMALDEPAVFEVVERVWVKQDAAAKWRPVTYSAKAEVLKKPGWRRWLGRRLVEGEDEEDVTGFAPVAGGLETCRRFEVEAGRTKPPAHFNDKTLLAAMETASQRVNCAVLDATLDPELLVERLKARGLGTPATRAEIIDELVRDKYLAYDGGGKSRHFVALPRGRQLYAELLERAPFMVSPAVTAEWEAKLYDMEGDRPGAMDRVGFLEAVKASVLKAREGFEKAGVPPRPPAAVAKESGAACPKSGGPVMDFGLYWVFPGWPEFKCRKVFAGREMRPEEWGAVLQGIESGNPVELAGLKSKTGKSFSAWIVREDDKKFGPGFGFKFNDGPKKPGAGGPPAKSKPAADGALCPKSKAPVQDFGDYWVFPGWPEFKCRKVFVGREMTPAEWGAVLRGIEQKSPVRLEGLISKAGKKFAAFIVRQDDKKFGAGFGFEFGPR